MRFIILLNAFACVRVHACTCDSTPLLKWAAFSWLYDKHTTGFKMKMLIWKEIPVLAKLVVTWYTNTNLIIPYLKTVFCYFGIFLEERKLIHLFTTKWINFQGSFRFFFSAVHVLARIDHSWQWKSVTSRKVPPH